MAVSLPAGKTYKMKVRTICTREKNKPRDPSKSLLSQELTHTSTLLPSRRGVILQSSKNIYLIEEKESDFVFSLQFYINIR